MRDTATIDMFDPPEVAPPHRPSLSAHPPRHGESPQAPMDAAAPAQPLRMSADSVGRAGPPAPGQALVARGPQAVVADAPLALHALREVVHLDSQGAVRFEGVEAPDDPDDPTLVRVDPEPQERCSRGFLKLLHHRWLYPCAALYERRAKGRAPFCLEEAWTRPRLDAVLIAQSRKHQIGEIDAIPGMRDLAHSCFEQIARAKLEAHAAAMTGQALLRTPRTVRHLDASCAVLARMFIPINAIPMYGQH